MKFANIKKGDTINKWSWDFVPLRFFFVADFFNIMNKN